jgi:hypothetical protein
MVALERAADGAAAEPQKGDTSGIHGQQTVLRTACSGRILHACERQVMDFSGVESPVSMRPAPSIET